MGKTRGRKRAAPAAVSTSGSSLSRTHLFKKGSSRGYDGATTTTTTTTIHNSRSAAGGVAAKTATAKAGLTALTIGMAADQQISNTMNASVGETAKSEKELKKMSRKRTNYSAKVTDLIFSELPVDELGSFDDADEGKDDDHDVYGGDGGEKGVQRRRDAASGAGAKARAALEAAIAKRTGGESDQDNKKRRAEIASAKKKYVTEQNGMKKKRALEHVLNITAPYKFPWHVKDNTSDKAAPFEKHTEKMRAAGRYLSSVSSSSSFATTLPATRTTNASARGSTNASASTSSSLKAKASKPSKKAKRGSKNDILGPPSMLPSSGDSKIPGHRPDSVLPPSFGASTQYNCYDCYVHRGEQGVGIKLKNIDEKAVVRGFAPWRGVSVDSSSSSSSSSYSQSSSSSVPQLPLPSTWSTCSTARRTFLRSVPLNARPSAAR